MHTGGSEDGPLCTPWPSRSVAAAQVRRDFGDLPLLKSITGALGPAMWFNAIVVLTHAASAPPDNASGPMSYEMYASNRTHLLQQSIRRAHTPPPPPPPRPPPPLPSRAPPPSPPNPVAVSICVFDLCLRSLMLERVIESKAC